MSSKVVDIVFVVDLSVNFRMCFFDDLELVQEKWDVARHYLFSHWFLIDTVSTAGGLIVWFGDSDYTLLKNMRLMK